MIALKVAHPETAQARRFGATALTARKLKRRPEGVECLNEADLLDVLPFVFESSTGSPKMHLQSELLRTDTATI